MWSFGDRPPAPSPREFSRASKDSARYSRTSEESDVEIASSDDRDAVDVEHLALEEDTFGMTIVALARDAHFIGQGVHQAVRISRLASTVGLLLVCIFLQCFLLSQVEMFVCGKYVHDIRVAYDVFERAMYNETTLTVNGKHRGVGGTWNPAGFATLDEVTQSAACRIPLSQPKFFIAILLLWTTTCFRELKQCTIFLHSVCRLQSTSDMANGDVVEVTEDGQFIIMALTPLLKRVIVLTCFIPRLFITCWLLWLGCRWLLATTCFADLILNAVALEFIITLKETLYWSVVPHRNKTDLNNTRIGLIPTIKRISEPSEAQASPPKDKSHVSPFNFLGAYLLFVAALAWASVYTYYLQQVLPDYKWDVHEVCIGWINKRYEV